MMKKNIKKYLEELAQKGSIMGIFEGGMDYVEVIPENLSEAKIRSLKHLSLEGLELPQLDPVINELTKLRYLDLQMNDFKELPDLSGLTDLRTINVACNLLTSLKGIPPWVRYVDAEFNMLKSYPKHLKNTQYLHIQQPYIMKVDMEDVRNLLKQDSKLKVETFSDPLRFDLSI